MTYLATSDLKIFTKTEHLLYRIYPNLINFPKAEKFALSQDIKLNFFELLKSISLADKVKSKRMLHSQEADGYLQLLKVQFKLAYKRKYISKGFFKDIDLELTEIGKMLSGYIRSVKK